MTEANETALRVLREPFPNEVIGLLPRATKKNVPDSEKSRCAECGQYIGPHIHLSYVGWAAVVDRILSTDILWTWDAYATDEHGLPVFRESPNGIEVEFWIRLTIAGVTRPGVGVVDKSDGDLAKKLISDALKNAASKFGVALELWSKDELESLIGNQTVQTRKRRPPSSSTPAQRRPIQTDPATDGVLGLTAHDRNKIVAYFARREGVTKSDEVLARVRETLGRDVESLSKLSAADGAALFSALDIDP